MDRRQFLGKAAAFAGTLALSDIGHCGGQAGGRRPNILVIMSDDMGFSDLGCYGGEIRTPTLDRLAAGGLRFTRFYNTARCCPSRACLLTGLYPHQASIGHMMEDRDLDGYRGDLNPHCVTIAEALRPAGYGSYAVGKWHVTRFAGPDGPKHNWPLQRGFDRYYGTINGAGNYYDPSTLVRDNAMMSPFADPQYRPKSFYYTDAITDNAIRFLQDHHTKSPDRPFFMYATYTAAHWPLHAPEADVAAYRGSYDAGYDALRKARFERSRRLGVIASDWKLSPTEGDWGGVQNPAWEARCMEVYAAMVTRMDRGIGRIVAELERQGELDNTLLLFMQDNGGCAEEVGRQGTQTRQNQPTLPTIAADVVRAGDSRDQTRSGYPLLRGKGVMPGPEDTFIAYGRAWANVSNTPFREYKHYVHEGGIATPLIVHWPGRLKERGGLCKQPAHLVDVMSTCLDAAGARYPTDRAGQAVVPTEGRSLVPAFAGKPIEREAIYWEHEGNRAVAEGQWKLVAKGPAGAWELYDIEADRTEMNNLSARYPDRVKAMAGRWEAWARRTHVLPWIWRPQYGQSMPAAQTHFEVTPGQNLVGDKAPQVVGNGFTVKVEVDEPAGEGVLLAQGGGTNGYAVYVKGAKPQFAVRRDSLVTVVAGRDPLPRGACTVEAHLAKDGAMRLLVDGKEVAAGSARGPLEQQPSEGLQVGRDQRTAAGDYEAPFRFGGKLRRATVDIER